MAVCPLCKSTDADVAPAWGAGAMGLIAVLCPAAPFIPSPSHCKGFLIESRLLRADIITPNIAANLAEIARQRYNDDGSDMLRVTEELVGRQNGDGNWNSGAGSGMVFPHKFNSAGTFPYYCSVHTTSMTATVIVSP